MFGKVGVSVYGNATGPTPVPPIRYARPHGPAMGISRIKWANLAEFGTLRSL
jgi:hypothetical protein